MQGPAAEAEGISGAILPVELLKRELLELSFHNLREGVGLIPGISSVNARCLVYG